MSNEAPSRKTTANSIEELIPTQSDEKFDVTGTISVDSPRKRKIEESPHSFELRAWKELLSHLQKDENHKEDEKDHHKIHSERSNLLSEILKSHHLHPRSKKNGVSPNKSKIVQSVDFHLNKYTKAKDVMVPTGPQASFLGCLFNMLKSIIGAGVLCLPISFKYSGVILTTIILFLTTLLLYYTAMLLIRTADICKCQTYEDAARITLGKKTGYFVDAITAFGNFLYLAAYLIALGDFGVQLLGFIVENASSYRIYVIFTIGFLSCFPLSLLPSINNLRFTSVMALVAILFFVCVVVGKAIESFSSFSGREISLFSMNMLIFRTIPLSIGAISCHVSIFPIMEEMKVRTYVRVRNVIGLAMFISMLLFIIIGLFGYLEFATATDGNILNNYSGGIVIPVVIVFSFVIITTYPLVNFSGRIAIANLIWRDHKVKTWRGYVISTVSFIGAFIISIFLKDLALILTVVGSITNNATCLVLPGLMFFAATKGNKEIHILEKILAIIIAVFGVALGILGVVSAFVEI